MGGISVSACSKCLWISSGVELTLFGQLGSSGKYGILRHSLGSSRPNAIVWSNKKIIIISVKCILLLSHSKTHSVAKQISHRGKNMVLLWSVPPRRMTFKRSQIHHREEQIWRVGKNGNKTHACKSSFWEAKAGRSEFKASLGNLGTLGLKIKATDGLGSSPVQGSLSGRGSRSHPQSPSGPSPKNQSMSSSSFASLQLFSSLEFTAPRLDRHHLQDLCIVCYRICPVFV